MEVKFKVKAHINIPVDQLKPFQGELKKLSEENFNKLRNEIIEDGFNFAPHVWKTDGGYFILDGHQRIYVLSQLKKQGYQVGDVPCNIVEADSIEDAKRKVLQAVSQYGKLTNEGYLEFTHDLDLDFTNFDLPDFTPPDLPDLETDSEQNEKDDDIPEVDDNPYGVQRGDIWQLGNHRVMCGDSTSEDDVGKLMNGEKAIFCFTSPPYSDQRDYRGSLELDTKHLAKFLSAPCDLFAVNLGMKRKDHEVVPYWDDYIEVAKSYGHKFLSWNVWNKDLAGSISNQSAMFSIIHEWIFIFGKHKKLNKNFKNDVEENKKRRRYDPINIKGKSQRLVRQKDGSTSYSNIGETFACNQMGSICHATPVMDRSINHPAMYPVELPEQYYLACTDQNDIVYEPFLGSGSSMIACEKTNRKCFGMEIDPHYCSVILKRWEDYTGQKALRI